MTRDANLAHDRRGSGPPLVLIHGLGGEWRSWEPVLARLAAEREVISLDLPGFGASAPLESGTVPTAAALAAAVARFLDAIGWSAPDVAGNSLGGWVALELGRLGRARTVTAISPAGFWSEGERRVTRAKLWLSVRAARLFAPVVPLVLGSALGRRVALAGVMTHPERLPAAAALAAARTFARAPAYDATLAAVGARGSRFERGAELRCPVTIAWGDGDRLLIPPQGIRAASEIPAARHVVLAGCGHTPMSDDPDLIARTILDGCTLRG